MAAAYKAAGRPLPRFSEDDYVDFCVTEAVMMKVVTQEESQGKEQKAAEIRSAWKAGKIDDAEAKARMQAEGLAP